MAEWRYKAGHLLERLDSDLEVSSNLGDFFSSSLNLIL